MSNCHCNTGITPDGSGQLGRYLKALDPSYAPIDGRSIEDLLLFAKRYAGQIRFYDIPESDINDGIKPGKVNWREFFRRDMAVIAASVAVLNIADIKKEYDELRERLDADPSPEKYAALFTIIIGMASRIDRWYSVAIPENPLRTDLDLAINSHLRWQMKRIMAYEDGYKFIDSKNPLNVDYSGIENDELWGLKDPIDADATIYQGSSPDDKIRNAALYADDIFNDFFSALQIFIDKGPGYMSFALEQYPAHQPHMALFIAFLQIFKLAQEQMNGLTGKMLDFYYKEVLQLTPKDSIPDKTHIIFELAKDIAQYDLAAGTVLSAGKDASGKEQSYKTATDLVLNQAKVKELKTIFIEKEKSNIKSIYARPVANSADGYGTPFETENPKWPTFGKGAFEVNKVNNICQLTEAVAAELNLRNEARVGFSIASPQLVLQGGNRIIALKMDALKNSNIADKQFEIWLTGEDGWLKIDKKITANTNTIQTLLQDGGDLSTGMPVESGYFFAADGTLYICLPVVEKAVIAFDLKLHSGRNYTTPYPVMQVLMGPDIGISENIFNTLSINNLSLSVRVGSINLPKSKVEFSLKGRVVDSKSKAPLASVTVGYRNSEGDLQTTITDQAGNFSVDTSINSILAFQAQGYKTQMEIVKDTNQMQVALQQGEGTIADLSYFIIPSFFDGLKQLTLQNDDGAIDISKHKPFDPFTAYPKFGSALYIGSDEIFNKPVDELAIHIQHLSGNIDRFLDLDYSILYGNDENTLKKAEIFKLGVLQQKQWTDLCTADGRDFTEGLLTRDVLFKRKSNGTGEELPALQRTPLSYATDFTNKTIKGFLQLQNNFEIEDNNDAAAKKSSDLNSKSIADTPAGNSEKDIFQKMAELALALKIKEISVSYFSELKNLDPEIDQFFHVYPFGMLEIYTQPSENFQPGNYMAALLKKNELSSGYLKTTAANFGQINASKDLLPVNAKQLLFPQFTYKSVYSTEADDTEEIGYAKPGISGKEEAFPSLKNFSQHTILNKMVLAVSHTVQKIEGGNNQYSGNIQEQGMLFIGLEKAVPLQSVSLLFQFAEGSATDEDNDPPAIQWSYLTNNQWRPMRGEDVVSDGTYGFQTTGIVKLNIPADASSNNTIISQGLHWFAVSVTENAHRIPQLVNVVTQAAEVVFEDNDNDQSHFDKALPAGSISKLAVKVKEVSKVEQPFASFDGKHREISKEFYTRVSERLRHKNRAINSWDYEHLVLDRFPSVYKVKCITATDPNCLCREGITVSAPLTENKRNYKVEIAGAEGLDAEKADPTEEGLINFKAAINELVSNPKATLRITLYAKTAAEKKFIEAIAGNIKQNIKKNYAKEKIDENSITIVTASAGGIVSIADLDVITPAEKAVAGDVICCGPQTAPGHVLLVPIANLKNRNSINPLQPKTSRRILIEIEAYLKKLTSPFVKVHAKNPVYEQVIAGFKVQFYTGTDQGFYLKKLNEEIVQYLTPWAFDENADVQFGQKIYASSIINFIEERPYVDFITDFVMGVCKEACCTETVTETRTQNYTAALQDTNALLNNLPEAIAPVETDTKAATAPAGGVIAKISGVVYDEKTGNKLPGVSVALAGTATGVLTGADGTFFIDADPAIAILSFTAVGYKEVTLKADGKIKFEVPMALSGSFSEVVVITYGVSKQDSLAEILANICGCNDVEKLMAGNTRVKGEIVAVPSTARSILVSVPQHIIIPYKAPLKPTPCEVRKEQRNELVTPAPEAAPVGAPPVAVEVKPPSTAAPVAEPAKEKPEDAVKKDIPPAQVKDMDATIAAETAKPVQSIKDLKDLADIKIADLVKANTVLIKEDQEIKKTKDTIKEEPAKDITKVADAITTKPLTDKVANPAPAEASQTIKKKQAAPAKTAIKKTATDKIKKNNK